MHTTNIVDSYPIGGVNKITKLSASVRVSNKSFMGIPCREGRDSVAERGVAWRDEARGDAARRGDTARRTRIWRETMHGFLFGVECRYLLSSHNKELRRK